MSDFITDDDMAKVEALLKFGITSDTRKSYIGDMKRFEVWAKTKFAQVCQGRSPGKHGFYFDWDLFCEEPDDGSTPFGATLFQYYAATYKKARNADTPVSKSTLSNVRSAMIWLAHENGYTFPTSFGVVTSKVLTAAGKRYAKALEAGEAEKKAREHLPFSVYYKICKLLWESDDPKDIRLLAWVTMLWNGICRPTNLDTLTLPNLLLFEDALQVTLWVTKTGQQSEQSDPYHLYFNPIGTGDGENEYDTRYTCFGLALARYLLCWTDRRKSNKVFFGTNTKNTLGTYFVEFLKKNQDYLGISDEAIKFLGIYSIRKGAGTFATSGSIGGPSMVSVGCRMQHDTGTQKFYLKYEFAGDQFVGRVVAGFPLNDCSFDTLPPEFAHPPSNLNDHLRLGFGTRTFQVSSQPVLRRLLANIAYHQEWIETRLSDADPIWANHLFRTKDLLATLKRSIQLGAGAMQATGIPPHVGIMREQRRNEELAERRHQELIGHITDLFEKNAIDTGSASPQFIQTLLSELENRIIERLPSGNESAATTTATTTTPLSMCHQWRGRTWNQLPEDYVLPRATIYQALQLWLFGVPTKSIRPFCDIKTPADAFSLKKEYDRFKRWKRVIGDYLIDDILRVKWEDDILPSKWTDELVERAWLLIEGEIDIGDKTDKNKNRNVGKLKVEYAYSLLTGPPGSGRPIITQQRKKRRRASVPARYRE